MARRIDRGSGYKLSQAQQALCSTESSVRLENFSDAAQNPEDLSQALQEARNWLRRSLFVRSGLRLKVGFCNYGFRLKPRENVTKAGSRQSGSAELEPWLLQNRGPIKRFMCETWGDWLWLDNCVVFWRSDKARRNQSPKVFTLLPEKCRYTDQMGVEKLKVRLGWSEQNLKGLPKEQIKRYSSGEIELDEKYGEHFRVLKRARVGLGFAWPGSYSLFHTLAQAESLEVADRLWAFVSRRVLTQFKLGHEITNGPRAGQATWFWNKARGEAIRKFFEGRLGAMDYSSNFDVNIEFPFPSSDRFSAERYESVLQRMTDWLGPVGAMMRGGDVKVGQMDAVLKLLRADVTEEREMIVDYCEDVINTVFKPPFPVKCIWSNRIFADARQSMEMVRHLLSAGPLSQRTALEESDFDVDEERARKAEEGKLLESDETKSQVLPVFDPAHGQDPAAPGSGRPPGKRDSGPRANE